MNTTFILATTEEILRTLSKRLRTQRLAQEISQQELAQMAGLSLGAVRNLKRNGQISLETLIRVVLALGLTTELDEVFVFKKHTIAQMVQAEQARTRQRAPHKRVPQGSQPPSK